MSTHAHHERTANDRRSHKIYETTNIARQKRNAGDVPDFILARDIDRGSRYFWDKRPGVHRDFMCGGFGEFARRAVA